MSDLVKRIEERVGAYAGCTTDYQLMKEALTELNTRASYIRDARNILLRQNLGPSIPLVTDKPNIFISAVVPARAAFLNNTQSFDTESLRRKQLKDELDQWRNTADYVDRTIHEITKELRGL